MHLTDKLTLTNEDNMELMARYPDKYFSLAICDPPYGIDVNMNAGRRKGEKKRYTDKKWDNEIPVKEYFEELFRVSKNQIIWGGNYFTEFLPPSMGWIVWDKNVPEGVSFSDFELSWSSFNIAAKKVRIDYCGFIGLNGQKRIHPTQKPVALYKWLLDKYAKQGDKILDTHLGSMSIAIACHDYGFELTGCELDTEYYEKGIKRVQNHVSQQKLF